MRRPHPQLIVRYTLATTAGEEKERERARERERKKEKKDGRGVKGRMILSEVIPAQV